jgi:hypothetical protein
VNNDQNSRTGLRFVGGLALAAAVALGAAGYQIQVVSENEPSPPRRRDEKTAADLKAIDEAAERRARRNAKRAKAKREG